MTKLQLQPRLTAIQLCSVPDIQSNLNSINQILAQIPDTIMNTPEHLVVLPECALYFGGKDSSQLEFCEPLHTGFMQDSLAKLAKTYCIYLVAGTIPIKSTNSGKFTASSLLFSPQGQCISHYKKMHLFDVDVADNEKSYRESLLTEPGEAVALTDLEQLQLGQAVCYDLRFPELFRSLTTLGANVIALPSAFTEVTGRAHWQALLQARAIENQVYIVAAGQYGCHENGRKTFGHSMIINPWGEIVVIKEQGSGYISTEFDAQLLAKVRADIPVAVHNKFSVNLNTKR